jgi:hypothetical protein
MDNERYLRVSKETEHKVKYILTCLVDTAVDPQEAATILMLVHLQLWEFGRSADGTIDTMLDGYCEGFKLNHELGKRSVQ